MARPMGWPISRGGLSRSLPIQRRSASGTQDRAVGLLIIFQDGDQGPADGHGRAVERVDERGSLFALLAIADAQPPGLVVGAVRGAGHFAVFAGGSPRPGIQASRSNLR